jgi:hypothetical protein
MSLVKRFFHQKDTQVIPALRGVAVEETQAAQRGMREHMEAAVAADRARRGATDPRPVDVPAAPASDRTHTNGSRSS